MKKKIIIIISLLTILFILGLITSYKDSARVRAGIEPKYTIKIINKSKSKITYIGLGYKVVRYTLKSINDPFNESDDYKYGSWFMKYEKNKTEEISYKETEIENVSYLLNDVSSKGATLIIKDTNKNPYTYSEWYKLEKKVDDKWKDVPYISTSNWGFNEMAYIVNDNGEVKFAMNWTSMYGKLPEGSYRIVKDVDNKNITMEFNLATLS